jgi:hypothetical protein
MRFYSVEMVDSSACDPSVSRRGAGDWSTLSMMAAAIRAGSPTARPLAGPSIFSKGPRWVAHVLGQGGSQLRTAVTEFGAGTTGLDDRHADTERGDLLRNGFTEALDAKFGGVIQRVAGEGDLSAVTGQLNDAPTVSESI